MENDLLASPDRLLQVVVMGPEVFCCRVYLSQSLQQSHPLDWVQPGCLAALLGDTTSGIVEYLPGQI